MFQRDNVSVNTCRVQELHVFMFLLNWNNWHLFVGLWCSQNILNTHTKMLQQQCGEESKFSIVWKPFLHTLLYTTGLCPFGVFWAKKKAPDQNEGNLCVPARLSINPQVGNNRVKQRVIRFSPLLRSCGAAVCGDGKEGSSDLRVKHDLLAKVTFHFGFFPFL